jgi:arsenite-transporting ATPase
LRLLIFTGTGGAGTTTVAAATALHAARRGIKTVLVPLASCAPGLEADAAREVEPGLAVWAAGPARRAAREVEPGLAVWAAGPARRAARSRAALAGPLAALAAALGVDPLDDRELPALPLVDEIAALVEIRDAAAAGMDLVVVDVPGLALAVRLAALPAGLGRAAERLLPVERRMLWAMGHGALPGSGAAAPSRGAVEAAERLEAELAEVRQLLAAPGTTARLVVAPQPPAPAAAARARAALALHGIRVDGAAVARLVPGDDGDPWRRARARVQAEVLAEAGDVLAPLPVLRAAERPEAPATAEELAAIGAELYGETLPCTLAESRPRPWPVVERDGDVFVLVLDLPGARRRDVEVARRGDDLLVDLAGERAMVRLPSGLRRCEVTGAAMRDGALRVAFRPDPALWRAL